MDSKFILYNLQLMSVENAIRAKLIIAKSAMPMISAKSVLLDIKIMQTEHASFVCPLVLFAIQITHVKLV